AFPTTLRQNSLGGSRRAIPFSGIQARGAATGEDYLPFLRFLWRQCRNATAAAALGGRLFLPATLFLRELCVCEGATSVHSTRGPRAEPFSQSSSRTISEGYASGSSA